MKNKIGILTSIGIGLSNIVYGKDFVFQTKYGVEPILDRPIADLYGVPQVEPPAPTFLEILQTIGKIAIIPIILIIGVVVVVKVNKKKKMKKVCKIEKDLNSMTKVYGVFRDDEKK